MDIYVEVTQLDGYDKSDNKSDWEHENLVEIKEHKDSEEVDVMVPNVEPQTCVTPIKNNGRDLHRFKEFYRSPTKESQPDSSKGKEFVAIIGDESDNSHTDYQHKSDNSSVEELEAKEMSKLAKAFKREVMAKKLGLDVAPDMDRTELSQPGDENLDTGYETYYFDSSDEYSYEEVSDGQGGEHVQRKKSRWPRFDSKVHVPIFSLGMVFRSRDQFKISFDQVCAKQL